MLPIHCSDAEIIEDGSSIRTTPKVKQEFLRPIVVVAGFDRGGMVVFVSNVRREAVGRWWWRLGALWRGVWPGQIKASRTTCTGKAAPGFSSSRSWMEESDDDMAWLNLDYTSYPHTNLVLVRVADMPLAAAFISVSETLNLREKLRMKLYS
jgi:hypothetical protein